MDEFVLWASWLVEKEEIEEEKYEENPFRSKCSTCLLAFRLAAPVWELSVRGGPSRAGRITYRLFRFLHPATLCASLALVVDVGSAEMLLLPLVEVEEVLPTVLVLAERKFAQVRSLRRLVVMLQAGSARGALWIKSKVDVEVRRGTRLGWKSWQKR